jgi:hypothetical protein
MRIKSFITATLIVTASFCLAESNKPESKAIKSELSKLTVDIEEVKKEIELSKKSNEDKFKTIEMTSAGISNQISSVSLVVGIFSLLFAVVAILIGIFVTRIQRKTEEAESRAEKAKNDAEAILKQVDDAKLEVNKIYALIQSSISELFEKIKREETEYIIKRLKREPHDIVNFIASLATRDLLKSDFKDFKECFLLLKSRIDADQPLLMFKIQFAQHFMAEVIRDEQLYPEIRDSYKDVMESLFNHEIEVAINEVISATSKDIQGNKVKIIEFFSAIKLHGPEISELIEETKLLAISKNIHKAELEEIFREVTENNPPPTAP